MFSLCVSIRSKLMRSSETAIPPVVDILLRVTARACRCCRVIECLLLQREHLRRTQSTKHWLLVATREGWCRTLNGGGSALSFLLVKQNLRNYLIDCISLRQYAVRSNLILARH